MLPLRMTYYVSSGTLNPSHCHCRRHVIIIIVLLLLLLLLPTTACDGGTCRYSMLPAGVCLPTQKVPVICWAWSELHHISCHLCVWLVGTHQSTGELLSISRYVQLYYSLSKHQLGWLNVPHSPTLPPPVTDKHWVVRFQEMSLSKR